MRFGAESPSIFFDSHFPRRLQRGILRVVTVAHHAAYRSVRSRFEKFTAHDLIGHERRAYVEQDLYAFAKRYSLTNSRPRMNYTKNSFHVELVHGSIVLTASSVQSPEQMVRKAVFRDTLARDPQGHLYENEVSSPDPDSLLYGIILYGALPEERFPSFVNVAFPDQECSRYLGDSVSLMDRFQNKYSELIVRLRREEGLA